MKCLRLAKEQNGQKFPPLRCTEFENVEVRLILDLEKIELLKILFLEQTPLS